MSWAFAIACLLWLVGLILEEVAIAIGEVVRDARRDVKRLTRAVKRWWRRRARRGRR